MLQCVDNRFEKGKPILSLFLKTWTLISPMLFLHRSTTQTQSNFILLTLMSSLLFCRCRLGYCHKNSLNCIKSFWPSLMSKVGSVMGAFSKVLLLHVHPNSFYFKKPFIRTVLCVCVCVCYHRCVLTVKCSLSLFSSLSFNRQRRSVHSLHVSIITYTCRADVLKVVIITARLQSV